MHHPLNYKNDFTIRLFTFHSCSRIDDPYFFESLTQFKKELELFGILENRHYDVEHIDYGNESVDSEVENTFNYRQVNFLVHDFTTR